MAVFAQHEAKAMSDRTKVALAATKTRGVVLGGLRDDAARMAEIAHEGSAAGVAARQEKAAAHRANILRRSTGCAERRHHDPAWDCGGAECSRSRDSARWALECSSGVAKNWRVSGRRLLALRRLMPIRRFSTGCLERFGYPVDGSGLTDHVSMIEELVAKFEPKWISQA